MIQFLIDFILPKKRLSRRILFTLLIIIIVRFINYIPIPDITQNYIYLELKNNQILNFLRYFSQGNFFILGPFTLGMLPYINASIIMQFLSSIIPFFKKLQNTEGEFGRQKIVQITRYLTLIIAFQYSLIVAFYIKPFVFGWTFLKSIQLTLNLTVGALIILWLTEVISEKGIGNGSSVIIFVNICSFLFPAAWYFLKDFSSIVIKIFFIGIILLGIGLIIFLQGARKQIPLTSAKSRYNRPKNLEIIKRRLPLRLNPSGILPLVLGSAGLNGISLFINRFSENLNSNPFFNGLYLLIYFLLILYFSSFSTAILIKPNDISMYLKKMSATLKYFTPGLITIQFLRITLNRLAVLGGVLLALAVFLPILVTYLNPRLTEIKGLGVSSLFILVGVAIDLASEIKTYKIIESYDDINKL